MAESIHSLAALKRHIATLDRAPAAEASPRFTCGPAVMDAALGGGLAQGRVHEIFASVEEEGAAAGLALLWFTASSGSAASRTLATVLAIAVMGGIDEGVQSLFPYRGADVRDRIVDCSSALLTCAILWMVLPKAALQRR